jgi:hypothetical protein
MNPNYENLLAKAPMSTRGMTIMVATQRGSVSSGNYTDLLKNSIDKLVDEKDDKSSS